MSDDSKWRAIMERAAKKRWGIKSIDEIKPRILSIDELKPRTLSIEELKGQAKVERKKGK